MRLDKKNILNNSGFTLMEVIIAVGIISVGSIGLLALMDYSIRINSISSNRLIASYLAQEGIEGIRNDRDHDEDWDDWFDNMNGDFAVSMEQFYWTFNLNPSSYVLRYDGAAGLYNHNSFTGSPSIFSRKVTLNSVSATEKQVISNVWWSERGRTNSVVIEDRLHNWQPSW